MPFETSHTISSSCMNIGSGVSRCRFAIWVYTALRNNQKFVNVEGYGCAIPTFSKYQKILQDFQEFHYSSSSIMHVKDRHADVPFKTLRDIWYQELKRLALECHGEKFSKQLVNKYYREYCDLRSSGVVFCINALAERHRVSTALMAKYILEQYLSHHYGSDGGVPKWSVKLCFTDLLRCPDTLLSYDIWRAQLGDMMFGVRAHRNKRSRGYSYEYMIECYLQSRGVEYCNEADMSEEGDVKKTPDFLLTPCIMRLQSESGAGSAAPPAYIHWIESKGLFGDPDTHHTLCKRQYGEYVHHYGPGLIIYWTGYVREIKTSFLHNVYVTNYLPQLLPYDSAGVPPRYVPSTSPLQVASLQLRQTASPATLAGAEHTESKIQTIPITKVSASESTTSPSSSEVPTSRVKSVTYEPKVLELHEETTQSASIVPASTSHLPDAPEIPSAAAALEVSASQDSHRHELNTYILSYIQTKLPSSQKSTNATLCKPEKTHKASEIVDIENIFKLAIKASKNYRIENYRKQ